MEPESSPFKPLPRVVVALGGFASLIGLASWGALSDILFPAVLGKEGTLPTCCLWLVVDGGLGWRRGQGYALVASSPPPHSCKVQGHQHHTWKCQGWNLWLPPAKVARSLLSIFWPTLAPASWQPLPHSSISPPGHHTQQPWPRTVASPNGSLIWAAPSPSCHFHFCLLRPQREVGWGGRRRHSNCPNWPHLSSTKGLNARAPFWHPCVYD